MPYLADAMFAKPQVEYDETEGYGNWGTMSPNQQNYPYPQPASDGQLGQAIMINNPVKGDSVYGNLPQDEYNPYTETPIDMIKDLEYYEGRRNKVYDDTVGVKTVGIGHNLMKPGSRAQLEAVGADYDSILSGKSTLTEEQIDALHAQDERTAEKDVRDLVPDFEDMHDNVKKILVNLSFQLGKTRLSKFAPTIHKLRAGDYSGAAGNLKATKWYGQSGRRSKDIVNDLMSMSFS